ncbi:MAG: hypothetical protein U0354_01850 [Candidatus Sericytochromatia bacterium]
MLLWIEKDGSIKKASKKELGLYNSIKDLKLDVKTIIQSWPISDNEAKNIIPFEDLEKAVITK